MAADPDQFGRRRTLPLQKSQPHGSRVVTRGRIQTAGWPELVTFRIDP